MLLTVTTTHRPATDLGYLLHKNPARVQSFPLSFGQAHVFYPQASEDRCTAALLLDVDSVWLVRGRRGPAGEAGTLEQYVNDRPYVASSLMSVAIAQVLGSALGGRSQDRQELADTAIPLEARLAVLPCRGGEELLRQLFEPLGYEVEAQRHSLDLPDWSTGTSPEEGKGTFSGKRQVVSAGPQPRWGRSYGQPSSQGSSGSPEQPWAGGQNAFSVLGGSASDAEGRPIRNSVMGKVPADASPLLSPYYTVTLRATCKLHELLSHLYVLIPVLDDEKHYWVAQDEVEKLLRHGEGWLAGHPERERIARRYLKHQRSLARQALSRLAEEDAPDPDETQAGHDAQEAAVEEKISLNAQRIGTVLSVLKGSGAKRVLDLGCGEGRLLKAMLEDKQFEEIVGLDVSCRALEIAKDRLHLDRLPPRQQQRIKLLHGSLTYRDRRLLRADADGAPPSAYDAALAIEVIEHFDPARLAAFERVLFEFTRPGGVILTTPNREYNAMWESLPAGRLRHRDHRFEWTREDFQSWANAVATRFGYTVRFLPVGPEDANFGPPTQMGIYERQE